MRRRLDRVGPAFVDHVSVLAPTGRQAKTFAAHHRPLALSRLRACGVDDLGFGDPTRWFATGRG